MTQRNALTSENGAPVANNQQSQTAGADGPILLQDHHLLEKLARFHRERIPERVVHARGSAAYGEFVTTQDVSRWTKARFLGEVGKKTEVFLRFSTVALELGSADTVRDPRGFAVKFYTEEGNYDLVGNNTPVFFLRDPLKFPDFIHSQKRDPLHARAGTQQRVGFLFALARGHPPVHVAVRRPRYPGELPSPRWLRLAHLPVGERGGRRVLGEVSLQDGSRDQDSHHRGGATHWWRQSQSPPSRPVAGDRARRVSVVDGESAAHAGGRRRTLPLQPVRSHQGMATRRLSAHGDRQAHAQPQSRQLLRGGRAVRLQPGQLRAGNWPLPRQDAARSLVRVRRCASLPSRRQPHAAACELPPRYKSAQLRPRRRYALRRQWWHGEELRAQQL